MDQSLWKRLSDERAAFRAQVDHAAVLLARAVARSEDRVRLRALEAPIRECQAFTKKVADAALRIHQERTDENARAYLAILGPATESAARVIAALSEIVGASGSADA